MPTLLDLFSSSTTVEERLTAIRGMTADQLRAIQAATDYAQLQYSVHKGIMSRLHKLERGVARKAFGWEVDVRFHNGEIKTFHWRGCSEKKARTNGLMKMRAMRIEEVRPVTEEEWLRAYGIGRM